MHTNKYTQHCAQKDTQTIHSNALENTLNIPTHKTLTHTQKYTKTNAHQQVHTKTHKQHTKTELPSNKYPHIHTQTHTHTHRKHTKQTHKQHKPNTHKSTENYTQT